MSIKRAVGKIRRKRSSPNDLSRSQIDFVGSLLRSSFSNAYDESDFDEKYLISSFYTKYDSSLDPKWWSREGCTPPERKAKAIAKWLDAEKRNWTTNGRLKVFSCTFGYGRAKFTSNQVVDLASKYVRETLGVYPPNDLFGGFTGGASTRVKRGPGSIAEKFVGKAHVSETALPYWTPILFGASGWQNLDPNCWDHDIRSASVLFTVPKNSDIDRVACKEPEINMYLQRGTGDFIRKRLKSKGIDLNDQSRNRNLARVGSKYRNLGTMDLSSASDLISTSLVEMLLPAEWFTLLDSLRVKQVELPDGSIHDLEMFSSMGNGFTFELESLIFWALTRSVATLIGCRGKIGVFGDDIIAPGSVIRTLYRVFPWFGFKVNTKKSFSRGPFRESCGGHYYNGIDVTPVYLREAVKTKTDVIRLVNQLSRWLTRANLRVHFCSDWILNIVKQLSFMIPDHLHGGQSFERTDALVTGASPRRRLVEVHKPIEVNQLGSLLWWFHEKERTPSKVFSPSEAGVVSRWVVRPNHSWDGGCDDSSEYRWFILPVLNNRLARGTPD